MVIMNNKGIMVFLLGLSVLMGFSSSSFFHVWVFLEVNTFLFIFILYSGSSVLVLMKYFLVQSFGSVLFVGASLWFSIKIFSFVLLILIIGMSLSIKLGVFPFQFWVESLGGKIGWNELMILLTLQKFLPLYLLSSIKLSVVMLVMALFGSIYSAVVSYTSQSVQKLMIYSSIFNLSWVVVVVTSNLSLTMLFMVVYSVIVMSLLKFFKGGEYFFIQQLMVENLTFSLKFLVFFILLTIGGIPPMAGFFLKLTVLSEMLVLGISFLYLLLLVFSSVFLLVFYISIGVVFLFNFKVSYFFNGDQALGAGTYLVLLANMLSFLFLLF